MTLLDTQAEAHKLLRAGLPITLSRNGSKKPLGDGWTSKHDGDAWHKKTWTLHEVDRAFQVCGELNPGVIYGPRSGLVDVECDAGDGDAAIDELFNGDVPVSPSFRSRRGRHRIMRFDPDFNAIDKAKIQFGSLEILLGCNYRAAHSLWPPSTTSDARRAWIASLLFDDCDPQWWAKAAKEKIWAKRQTSVYTSNLCVNSLCNSESEAVAAAIAATLPTGQGFRHRRLFHFARLLKAIPSLVGADVQSLRPHLEQWHEQALPCIGTKQLQVSWDDFAHAWVNVKFAAGHDPIHAIYQQAMLCPLTGAASRYGDDSLRRLVLLCRELQRVSGERPFYLACRTAGELLGISHMLASKRLKLLVLDEVLAVVKQGTRHRASEYRYLGD